MKVRTAACVCLAWAAACLACAAEQDVLIPYELDGYIGFVNQDLEKITEAEYDVLAVFPVSRYCAVVRKNNAAYIVVSGGQKIRSNNYDRFGSDSALMPVLIGDEYFAVPELIPEGNCSRLKTTVFSIYGEEAAVLYDWKIQPGSKSLDYIAACRYGSERLAYINAHGKEQLPQHDGLRLRGYDEALERGIVLTGSGRRAITDKDMNIIETFYDLSEFSDGLIAGQKAVEELGDNMFRGGYYDADGRLRIPVVFHKRPIHSVYAAQQFNSGVLPCRIIDGDIHVMGMYPAFGDDWAIIDTEGNPIASGITAKRISEFRGGAARIVTLNGAGEEEVRLMDTRGKILTAEAFDEIAECINGYCMAKKDGENYLISAADGTAYRCRDF